MLFWRSRRAQIVCLVLASAFHISAARVSVAVEEKLTKTVDLNLASAAELEAIPGIGPSLAQKIIAGRPYSAVDELTKSGVSKAALGRIRSLVTVGRDKVATISTQKAANDSQPAVDATGATKLRLLNLNSAKENELLTLPEITPTTAKKIIAGRPYKSIDDLSKAGVSAATILKLRSQVTTSDEGTARTALKPITTDSVNPLIDLNKASEAELLKLPGVGEAEAKKIVARRPYKSVSELAKSGLPAALVAKIKSQVTTGEDKGPAAKGMVWVNRQSKKYHKEGSQWYGKTKSGEYMPEEEAIKAGYVAAKRS